MGDLVWQEILEAVYCQPGECQILDSQTARDIIQIFS